MKEELCDFCVAVLGKDQYTHLTDRFTLPGDAEIPAYVDDGEWGACPTCHALILDLNSEALAARLARPLMPSDASRRFHDRVLAAFWKHYHGSYRTGR